MVSLLLNLSVVSYVGFQSRSREQGTAAIVGVCTDGHFKWELLETSLGNPLPNIVTTNN